MYRGLETVSSNRRRRRMGWCGGGGGGSSWCHYSNQRELFTSFFCLFGFLMASFFFFFFEQKNKNVTFLDFFWYSFGLLSRCYVMNKQLELCWTITIICVHIRTCIVHVHVVFITNWCVDVLLWPAGCCLTTTKGLPICTNFENLIYKIVLLWLANIEWCTCIKYCYFDF